MPSGRAEMSLVKGPRLGRERIRGGRGRGKRWSLRGGRGPPQAKAEGTPGGLPGGGGGGTPRGHTPLGVAGAFYTLVSFHGLPKGEVAQALGGFWTGKG